jgi:hypothetical protein
MHKRICRRRLNEGGLWISDQRSSFLFTRSSLCPLEFLGRRVEWCNLESPALELGQAMQVNRALRRPPPQVIYHCLEAFIPLVSICLPFWAISVDFIFRILPTAAFVWINVLCTGACKSMHAVASFPLFCNLGATSQMQHSSSTQISPSKSLKFIPYKGEPSLLHNMVLYEVDLNSFYFHPYTLVIFLATFRLSRTQSRISHLSPPRPHSSDFH